MSDLTVYAEALIAAVARAFYDDEAVCLIDVLIRDKFLRDDDMAPRLSLPAKKLRATLQFLQDEHLVRFETVDDLTQGGSQATKFWYIDYNYAVHTIRLRLHLMRRELEMAERRARSSSFYLCPGYSIKRCNGRYTEEEAQSIVDMNTGLFLCRECKAMYEADPNAPSLSTYTLQLVDNTKDLKLTMDRTRRVQVQLSAKRIGNHMLRTGIYDLVQTVRGRKSHGGTPPVITSNLPSENFALGIGSKRLAGTGRTAGIKARKLEQQGVAASATAARDYLVGNSSQKSGAGSSADWTFLKNAMGTEIGFSVERGGGARANLLATRMRRRHKLMDAAAARVGIRLSQQQQQQLKEQLKRKEEEEMMNKRKAQGDGNDKSAKKSNGVSTVPLEFLNNNIGRGDLDSEMARLRQQDIITDDLQENEDFESNNPNTMMHVDVSDANAIVLVDEPDDPILSAPLWEEEARKSAFQANYSREMNRQMKLLQLDPDLVGPSGTPKSMLLTSNNSSSTLMSTDNEEASVDWEDG